MMTRLFLREGGGSIFFFILQNFQKKKVFFLSFCFSEFNYNNENPMHIKNRPFHCFGVNCFQTNCELVANFVI